MWQDGSVHRARWPTYEEAVAPLAPGFEDERGVQALEFASAVLGAIRKKKSEEQRPLKTGVSRAVIVAPAAQLALLADVEQDLRASGLIERLESGVGETLHVEVELSPNAAAQDRLG